MKKKKKLFTRYSALIVAMFVTFSIIASRLVTLQVVMADDYTELANKSSVAELQSFAPRGNIIDRNGQVLATDEQSYMLTYTETDSNKYDFIPIMNSVFKIIDDNGEKIKDDFELKTNPFSFVFKNTDGTDEIRFKKDRGMDQLIYDKMFKGVKNPPSINNLSVEQQNKINAELLKVTPEETFNYLVKKYDLTPEGDFMNLVAYYKTDHDAALSRILDRYKPTSKQNLVSLLNNYYKAKTQNDKDTIKAQLVKECAVDKMSYSVEEQRRLMIVKDELYQQRFSSYKPVSIADSIKKSTSFIIEQKYNELVGVNVQNNPVRVYPNGELGSAFLGYISKITAANKDKYEMKGYDTSYEYVGTTGIEAAFEENLRGKTGSTIVKLNNKGRAEETLGEKQAYPGQTVQLTIDKNLQSVAEGALDSQMKYLQNHPIIEDVNASNATRGAVVVLDVNTGAVLALASKPGFDPNVFAQTGGLTPDLIKKYLSPDYNEIGNNFISKNGLLNNSSNYGLTEQQLFDKMFPKIDSKNTDANAPRKDAYDVLPKPLYNNATSALIPPGSTFKPVTALAGLELGVIEPYETIDDEAYFDFGANDRRWFISDGRHGFINLMQAIGFSSNPYFMTVAKRLKQNTKYGDDALAQYAWKLGLGVDQKSNTKPATGIEISESFGQAYNSTTLKNQYAVSYLSVTMDQLKTGSGIYAGKNFGSYTPIDLYYEDNDSSDVKSAKKALKDYIQNSIRTGAGKGDNNCYVKLLTQWLNIDPQYKDKKIPSSEIKSMSNTIYRIAIDDAFNQCNTSNPDNIANICNASIGQGINNFTPLQLTDYIATLVNGGTRYKVHLVDKIKDGVDGSLVYQSKPEALQKNEFNSENIQQIINGMKKVTDNGGTAAAAFQDFDFFPTGGKTGTAQSLQDQTSVGRSNYALYVGFAPANNPQIAVCVVIFDGGYGSEAAPIARTLYEYYFKDEIQKIKPGYATPTEYDYKQYLK